MSLLWADGFDHYGNVQNMAQGSYTQALVDMTTDPSKVRTGTYALDVSGGRNGNALVRVIEITGQTIGFGFALQSTAGPPADRRLQYNILDTNGTSIIYAAFNGNSGIDMVVNGDIVLSTPGNVLVPGAFSYLEFKVVIDELVGAITIVCNNAVVASTSNINTVGNSNGIPGSAGMYRANGAQGWPSWYMDDYVIWDGSGNQNNTFFGDIRCRTIFPESNGENQQWNAVGNPNAFACVNQVPPQPGVDYIQAANAGDFSSFNMNAVPLNTGVIHGVMLHANINKADAGVCGVIYGVGSQGGTLESPDINPGTGAAYYSTAFDTDPQGNPWTVGNVNTINALIERTQ